MRRGSRLALSRAFGVLLGVVVCTVLALHDSARVEVAHGRPEIIAGFATPLQKGAAPETLGEAEEQLVIDAVRGACAQRTCKRVEAAMLRPPGAVPRATAWRYGATFARLYVPERAREVFAPPSTSDPDA